MGWIRPVDISRGHDCSLELSEVPDHIQVDAIWQCEGCRRKWKLISKPVPGRPPDPMRAHEGISMTGPDGARYWRAHN